MIAALCSNLFLLRHQGTQEVISEKLIAEHTRGDQRETNAQAGWQRLDSMVNDFYEGSYPHAHELRLLVESLEASVSELG